MLDTLHAITGETVVRQLLDEWCDGKIPTLADTREHYIRVYVDTHSRNGIARHRAEIDTFNPQFVTKVRNVITALTECKSGLFCRFLSRALYVRAMETGLSAKICLEQNGEHTVVEIDGVRFDMSERWHTYERRLVKRALLGIDRPAGE